MLPQIKIISLLIKVFARPFIYRNRQKQLCKVQKQNKSNFQQMLITLGCWHYQSELKIDQLYYDLQSEKVLMKRLENELAIERGYDFFLELLVWTILITFSTYEILQAYKENKVNQQLQNKQLDILLEEIKQLNEKLQNDEKLMLQLLNETQQLLTQTMNCL